MIIDHIKRDAGDKNVACIYLYLRHTQDIFDQIVVDLLRQLVRQQKSEEVCSELREKYDEWRRLRTWPSSEDYLVLIKLLARAFSKVFFIIDALDDCHNSKEENTQEQLHAAIRVLRRSMNILVTSRSSGINKADLNPDHAFHLEARPEDIELYVRSRIVKDKIMANDKSIGTPSDLQNDIIRRVSKATGRVCV